MSINNFTGTIGSLIEFYLIYFSKKNNCMKEVLITKEIIFFANY